MDKVEIANAIRNAFSEGYAAYTSPAQPNTTYWEEWEQSEAKKIYDKLLADPMYEVVLATGVTDCIKLK